MGIDYVYDEVAVRAFLQRDLPAWTFSNGQLQRVYKTKDWNSALALVNRISPLAEAASHHPDIELAYGRIHVRLMTHSAGGITDKDFSLAVSIERLLARQ